MVRRYQPTDLMTPPLPVSESPSLPTHGGSRPGAGKPKKTHRTQKVTVELHEGLAQKWADHCTALNLSKPESIAKLVKWKKPKS